MRGTVQRFSDYRGYGFITDDNGKPYFVHYTNIISDGFKSLRPGNMVEFDPIETEKGSAAQNVRVIDEKNS